MQQESFETSCAFLLYEVSRLLRKRFDAKVSDLGFTQSTWRVIGFLARSGEMRPSDLGDQLAIETAPLVGILDRLATEGWIVRRADPSDRRAKLVRVTEKSLPIFRIMQTRFRELEAEFLASLGDEQQQQLIQCLLKIRYDLSEGHCAGDSEVHGTFWLLLDCARRMSRLFGLRLAELGFTRTQWLVLSSTLKREGIRQIELASLLELAPAPLGKVVDQLEDRGWLERRPDEQDRRAKRLYLSDLRANELASIRRQFSRLQGTIVRSLTAHERRKLSETLQAIHHQLLGRTDQ